MGVILTIIALSLLVIILSYSTFNLLKKNETAEDILMGYWEYLDKISKVIEASDERLKQIDSRGSFKSDDEVGFFFEQLKELQKILNDFKIKNLQ